MVRSIHSPENERLRSILIAAREKAGLTQAEVAAKLGRPQSFVSKYESGERHLNVMAFVQVCEALGVDPKSIVGRLIAGSVR
jgi:transcriptional regulator with XRE-family HTH domain